MPFKRFYSFSQQHERRSINLLILVLALAAMMAAVGYLLFTGHRDTLRSTEITARNIAHILDMQLDASLRRIDVVLAGVVEDMNPVNMSDTSVIRFQGNFDAQLDLRTQRFPEVAGLRVFNASGDLIYTSHRRQLKRIPNATQWETFAYLRDHPDIARHYSSVFIAPAIEKEVIAVGYAIRDHEDRFLGVAMAFLDLDYFRQLFASLDIGTHGVIAIRRAEDFRIVLCSLPETPQHHDANTTLPEQHIIRRSLPPAANEAVLRYTDDDDGVDRVHALHRVDNYPFVIQVGLGTEEALAAWNDRNRLILLLGLPLIAVVIALRMRAARIERDRDESEERFRTLFQESAEPTLLLEGDHFIECNRAARDMLRLLPSDNITDVLPASISPERQPDGRFSREKAGEMIDAAFRHGSYRFEWVHTRRTGESFFADVTLTRIRHRERRLLHVVWRDITARKQAEERVNLLATAFRHSGEGLVITDRQCAILEINDAFTRITGYSAAEVIGRDPKMLAAGHTAPEVYRAMWASLQSTGAWQGELWNQHKDGHVYPQLLTISAVTNAHGQVENYIGNFTDITERKAAEERIQHLAHHDALTRLPNRLGFETLARQALAQARRDKRQLALMFIDLDRFKNVNDTLGHHIGDELLTEMATRLRNCVRESDIVARLGGDEFVVILPEASPGAALAVARKLVECASKPFPTVGVEIYPTFSVGICLYPDDGKTLEELMKNADLAMYQAKADGRNGYCFYSAEQRAQTAERILIESHLRQAIERQEFFLEYQPQVRADDGVVVGVEALVRWRHPQRGIVSPLLFIPVAEECGLILPLGAWVLGEAVRQLAVWREQGINTVQMAINISAAQLRSETLVDAVHALFAQYALVEGDIELEITESMAMDQPEQTIACMQRLREIGVQFAVDDFGTGYSSLAYLRRLPLDRIKLDRSFVMDIEHDTNDATICAATIAMAHAIGLEVVAEGVETEVQAAYLRERQCQYLQGYHFSRPLPPAACAEYILRQRTAAAPEAVAPTA